MRERKAVKLPRGVTIRENKSGPRVQIAFAWQGEECRELLQPLPISASLIAHAASLRTEIQRKIAAGTFHYADYFPGSPRARAAVDTSPRVLMETLLNRQLKLYEQRKANGTLSASTLAGFSKIIRGRLIPKWGQVALQDVSASALREWVAGIGGTSKTVRNILGPLRSAFDDAIADELIDSNPLDRIALDKLIRQTARKSVYEVEPFDAAERKAILDAATPEVARLVRFLLGSGLRTSEAIGLKWGCVDFVHGTVRVEEVFVAGEVKESAKTEAGNRDVEVDPDALAALREQKPASMMASDHVWLHPGTGKPFTGDKQIREGLWRPLLKKAGVRYRIPYQTRHTFASRHLSDGANPWWVAAQLGHADLEMVTKTYGKWLPDSVKRGKFARNSHEKNEAAPQAAPLLGLAK